MTEMAVSQTFQTERQLEINKSADEVWEYLSNLANAMTTNQFHMFVELDEHELRNPHVGLVVPIMHDFLGAKHIRLARVTKYEDYSLAWGERLPDDAGYQDRFPHSEGWTVEAIGKNKALVRNNVRGRFMSPLGELFGQVTWDAMMPPILDNDLQDLALAVGAIDHRAEIEIPAHATALLKLQRAKQIDGKSLDEFFGGPQLQAKKHD